MTIGLPKAPVTPIYVMYREVVYDPNEEFTKENAGVHAILPYLDLPKKDKERGGFAYIRANGQRGIITKETIEKFTIPRNPSDEAQEIVDFHLLWQDKNWEPIYLSWPNIDFERQFSRRGDDGMFDMVTKAIFNSLEDMVICPYCAHPMYASDEHEECEECGYELTKGEEPATIVFDPSSTLGEEWQ